MVTPSMGSIATETDTLTCCRYFNRPFPFQRTWSLCRDLSGDERIFFGRAIASPLLRLRRCCA